MGMHGSGKSTCAHRVALQNKKAVLLDADKLRSGLNSDLGWGTFHRIENARRIAWVAAYLVEQHLFPIVCCTTPLKTMRRVARNILPHSCMVFLDAPLEQLRERRGAVLYERAKEDPSFALAGVNFPFERPDNEPGVTTVPNLDGCQGEAFRIIFDLIEAHRP